MAAYDDRSFGTVAAAASSLGIGLAAIYWGSRTGFANPVRPVVEVTALSLFMINAPYVARMISRRIGVVTSWATSYSTYWLGAVLFALLAGRFTGSAALIVFVVAGILAFAVSMGHWLRTGSLWRSATVVAGALAFSTFAGGVVWGRIYKSPLFMEMFSLNGIVHHDPIGLAGLANMLITYGVPTPGLDGIPHMAYHWGTPWMFAQLSQLLGTSTLEFYSFGYVVTIVPFFFGGMLCFATELRGALNRAEGSDLRDNLVLPAILLIAVIGVFPITGMDAMGVWTSNLMISESYAAGLPVALLLLAITVLWWKGGARGWIFPALVLPLGILVLGYLKISLMILGFLAVVYAGVRKRLYRQPGFIVIGIALTAAFFVTWSNVSLPEHREGIVPLDFLKGFVPPGWWPFFFLTQLFWSLLYVTLRLRAESVRSFGDLRGAVREGRILDAEVVTLIAVAGVGPGLVTHIDGGSAFYFSDIQRWLSVGLLIAGAGTLLRLPSLRGPDARTGSFSTGKVRMSTVLITLLALPLAVSMGANFVHWTKRMLAANAATREGVAAAGGIEGTRNHLILTELQRLAQLPRTERRRTALFIPQSETRYWALLARDGACSFSGHVAPTLAGMAMVDGMPPHGCTLSRYYGLGLFEPRAHQQVPADTLPAALCERAARYGLSRVMTAHFDSTGRATTRVDECQTAQ
ncbi:MAG: hypothetical protein ACR2GK_02775 [Gemmatimonadaceae bacterium]